MSQLKRRVKIDGAISYFNPVDTTAAVTCCTAPAEQTLKSTRFPENKFDEATYKKRTGA